MSVLDHARAIMAIRYQRVPQRAEGKYPDALSDGTISASVAQNNILFSVVEELRAVRSGIDKIPSKFTTKISYFNDIEPIMNEANNTDNQIVL